MLTWPTPGGTHTWVLQKRGGGESVHLPPALLPRARGRWRPGSGDVAEWVYGTLHGSAQNGLIPHPGSVHSEDAEARESRGVAGGTVTLPLPVSQSGLHFGKEILQGLENVLTDPPSAHKVCVCPCAWSSRMPRECVSPLPGPTSLHTQPWNCSICVQGRRLRNGARSPSESKPRSRLDQCSFPRESLDAATPSGHSTPHSGFRKLPWGGPARAPVSSWAFRQAQKRPETGSPVGFPAPHPSLEESVAEPLSRGQSESAEDG